MNWSRKLTKSVALTIVGFLIPLALLIPVEIAFSEFGNKLDWETLFVRYLPPCTGCSLFFLASAMTSSTPRRIVTFVQSLFLHFVVFIFSVMVFTPIQHVKFSKLQSGPWAWIPFVAVLMLFAVLMVIGNIPTAIKPKDPSPMGEGAPDSKDAYSSHLHG